MASSFGKSTVDPTAIAVVCGTNVSFRWRMTACVGADAVDTMLRDLAQHDINAFTNNTQFINERYSDDDNPFR